MSSRGDLTLVHVVVGVFDVDDHVDHRVFEVNHALLRRGSACLLS